MFFLFDHNLTIAANVAALFGVFFVFLNNTPQVLKTIATKGTTDFSLSALILRVISSCLWFTYSLELKNALLIISSSISLLSAGTLFLYKIGTN